MSRYIVWTIRVERRPGTRLGKPYHWCNVTITSGTAAFKQKYGKAFSDAIKNAVVDVGRLPIRWNTDPAVLFERARLAVTVDEARRILSAIQGPLDDFLQRHAATADGVLRIFSHTSHARKIADGLRPMNNIFVADDTRHRGRRSIQRTIHKLFE